MSDATDLTPRAGLEVSYRNADGTVQRFECSEVTEGRAVNVATWSTNCAVCGSNFTVATPTKARVVRHRSHALGATRCDECRSRRGRAP